MRRPSLSLLIVFLSGLLFTSCYKNDLRELYEQLTKQVTLQKDGYSVESVSAPTQSHFYVPSNQDAKFNFKLLNPKDYYINPALSILIPGVEETIANNEYVIEHTAGSAEIAIIIKKAFLLKHENKEIKGAIHIGDHGTVKAGQLDDKRRDFPNIDFTFTINTPPEFRNLSLI